MIRAIVINAQDLQYVLSVPSTLEAVLNPPVPPRDAQKVGRRGVQTGNVTAKVDLPVASNAALDFEHHQAFQGRSFVGIAQTQQILGGRNAPTLAQFQPAMAFRHGFRLVIRPLLKVMRLIFLEDMANVIEQRGLIRLNREDIVRAVLDNVGGDLGLRANRINRDDTAFQGQDVQQWWNRRHFNPGIGPTDDRTNGNHDDVEQLVQFLTLNPRIGDLLRSAPG